MSEPLPQQPGVYLLMLRYTPVMPAEELAHAVEQGEMPRGGPGVLVPIPELQYLEMQANEDTVGTMGDLMAHLFSSVAAEVAEQRGGGR